MAAVFAAHPLNAEAVSWVTARKDLLMSAWSLAALLCWHRAGSRWTSRWAWRTLGRDTAAVLPLLAMVGIVFLVADAGTGAAARRPPLRASLAALLLVVVVLGAVQARQQAALWRDPVDLWLHTLAATRDNTLAHQNLAVVLDNRGRPAEAWPHLQAALAIEPKSITHYNAGNVLLALDRRVEAERQYRQALARNPGLVEAALNLGSLLGQDGRLDEARAVLLQAEARRPDSAAVQFNLGLVAWLADEPDEAAPRLRRALQLDPGHATAKELLDDLERR